MMRRLCHRLGWSLLSGILLLVWAQCVRAAEPEVKPTTTLPQASEPQQESHPVTPLHRAVAQGDLEQVRLLLSQGADVHATAHGASTPLLWAAARGYTTIVALLLKHGAEVAAPSSSQQTPLHWAVLNGHEATARVLLAARAPVAAVDSQGHTPLHLAAIAGHTSLARLLLDSGALLDPTDVRGYTPLYWAVIKGHTDLVGLLLARGANPLTSGARDESLLVLARRKGYGAIMALLSLPEAAEVTPAVPSTPEPSRRAPAPIRSDTASAARPDASSSLPASASTAKATLPETPASSSSPVASPVAQPVAPSPNLERRARPVVPVVAQEPPETATPTGNDFVVQFAALSSTSLAQQLWSRQQQDFPTLLGQRPLMLEEVDLGARGILYRVRTGPFPNRDDATAFCAHFRAQQRDCWVVPRFLQASGKRKP